MIESILSEYVTTWKLAMLSALVLMMVTKDDRGQKLRVWCVMMAASFAAYIQQSVGFFMAIQGLSALLIMLPPKNKWQRAIGFLYTLMLLATMGYAIAIQAYLHNFLSPAPNPILLKIVHDSLAWLSVLLLFGWSGDGICADNSARGRFAGSVLFDILRGAGQRTHVSKRD